MIWVRHAILLAAAITGTSSFSTDVHSQGESESRYSVIITGYDPEWQIPGIKAIREETGLAPANAKRLIEGNASVVKADSTQFDAEAVALRLRSQHVTFRFKPSHRLAKLSSEFKFEVLHSPNNGFQWTADRTEAPRRLISGGAAAQPRR